ncbi:MAG: hypothetical protein AAB336_10340 [Acidobacteriota bacterium]
MKRIFSTKSMFLVRAVLLFGLLNGLLFSCGEGIRLFPFPNSEAASQIEFEPKINNGTDYEKNFHRFENHSTNFQVKNQKSHHNHWLNATLSLKAFDLNKLAITQKQGVSEYQTLFDSRLFSQTLGSRAPPLL